MGRCISCNKRKGKRNCLALSGLICTECCGTRRLIEISCPKECIYLREAQLYSIQRVDEKPADFSRKQWELFLFFEGIVYNFLREFSNFTDEELLEVLSLLEKEYQTRRKNLFLPSLQPRSSRALKLKKILEEEFTKLEKEVNEFGLPIFTLDDFVKILSFEKERIERYIRENRNVGNNLFLQVLKSEVEFIATQRANKG